LHSRTPESLELDDVNNSSYDPWTECLVQGKAYYLPAMARLALGQPVEGELERYAELLASNIGQDRKLFDFCSEAQRSAILAFLDHLLTSRKQMHSVYTKEIILLFARQRPAGGPDRHSSDFGASRMRRGSSAPHEQIDGDLIDARPIHRRPQALPAPDLTGRIRLTRVQSPGIERAQFCIIVRQLKPLVKSHGYSEAIMLRESYHIRSF